MLAEEGQRAGKRSVRPGDVVPLQPGRLTGLGGDIGGREMSPCQALTQAAGWRFHLDTAAPL